LRRAESQKQVRRIGAQNGIRLGMPGNTVVEPMKGGIPQGNAMNVTLTQVAQVAPDAAQKIRDAIRSGRLPAERRAGAAGRPYVFRTEDLVKVDREFEPVVRQLESGEAPALPPRGRTPRPDRSAGGVDPEMVERLVSLMETQSAMMRTLMDTVARQAAQREMRLERMQEDLQQLSYKLGQAHQEIGRLERLLGERQALLPRVEQA
jgi:uncharacterized coiled-coil protein SlyX